MLKEVYGTTAAYVAMGSALKSMAQRSQGAGVAPRMSAEDQGVRLRTSAEQAVIAEGYDAGDARGRPVQISAPARLGRWERLVPDGHATEDTQDGDSPPVAVAGTSGSSATTVAAAAIPPEEGNAWAEFRRSGQVVRESLPPEPPA